MVNATLPLTDITIVIPTYGRPRFVLRTMKYFNTTGIQVIIMDGSKFPISDEDLQGLNSNISYIHSLKTFEERLATAGKMVKTKYVAMLGDDEFLTVSGLLKCKTELDNDPELVACTGTALAFYFNRDKVEFTSVYDTWLTKGNVNQEDAISRMYFHSSNAVSAICYSLVRTEVWEKAFRITSCNPNGIVFLTEIFFELAVCYQGKTKVIEDLYWFRSHENIPLWQSEPVVALRKWLHDPRYVRQRKLYLDAFFDTLVRFENGFTRENFKLYLVKALELNAMRGSTLKLKGDYRGVRQLEKIVLLAYYLVPASWVTKFKLRNLNTEILKSEKKTESSHASNSNNIDPERFSTEISQVRLFVEHFYRSENPKISG